MKKEELGPVLADKLQMDLSEGMRLAGKLQLLAKKYRTNLVRKCEGGNVNGILAKTKGQINEICANAGLEYRIIDDPRGPILRINLGKDHEDSLAGMTIIDDGM